MRFKIQDAGFWTKRFWIVEISKCRMRDWTNADFGPGEIDAKIITRGKIAETNKCKIAEYEIKTQNIKLR